MIIKRIIYFFCISVVAFAGTNWTGNDKKTITIVYKILEPLIVNIEKPEKIIARRNEKEFSYSSKKGKPLLVTVEAPYNNGTIDDILRKVYEKVYFKLEEEGNFYLENKEESSYRILAKGYFVDSNIVNKNSKVTYYYKDFPSKVEGNSFYTTTGIDVDFYINNDIPLGVYEGTLKLNVWFGGSI